MAKTPRGATKIIPAQYPAKLFAFFTGKLKIFVMSQGKIPVQLHQVNLFNEKVCFGLGIPFIISYCSSRPEISGKFDIRQVNWTIYDWRSRRGMIEEIVAYITESRPAIVGFSLFIWSLELIKDVIREVKKRDPGILIIVGGPCASSMQGELIRQVPQIDYLVSGEGEVAFAKLLEGLSDKRSAVRKGRNCRIEGVYSRASIAVQHSGAVKQAVAPDDLDCLGSPVRQGLVEISPEDGALTFEWTRGCPYRCNYCCWSVQSSPLRRFSKEYIVQDVRWAIEKGFKDATICDSAINHSDHYLGELCSALVEADAAREFTFRVFFQYKRFSPKQLSMIGPVGQICPMIGLETDDAHGLKALSHPPFDRQKFERCIELLQAKQPPFVTMMTAVPGDTVDKIKRRVDYVLSLGCSMTVFPLCVPPGTGLWNAREKHGFEIDPENMFVVRQIPTMSFEQYGKVMEYVSGLGVDSQKMEIYCYNLLGFDRGSMGSTS